MVTYGLVTYIEEVVEVTEVVTEEHQDVVRLEDFIATGGLVGGLVLEHEVAILYLWEAQIPEVLLRTSPVDLITVGDVVDVYTECIGLAEEFDSTLQGYGVSLIAPSVPRRLGVVLALECLVDGVRCVVDDGLIDVGDDSPALFARG